MSNRMLSTSLLQRLTIPGELQLYLQEIAKRPVKIVECLDYILCLLDPVYGVDYLEFLKLTREQVASIQSGYLCFLMYYLEQSHTVDVYQGFLERIHPYGVEFGQNQVSVVPTKSDLEKARNDRKKSDMPHVVAYRALKATLQGADKKQDLQRQRYKDSRSGVVRSLKRDFSSSVSWHWEQLSTSPFVPPLLFRRAFQYSVCDTQASEQPYITLARRFLSRNSNTSKFVGNTTSGPCSVYNPALTAPTMCLLCNQGGHAYECITVKEEIIAPLSTAAPAAPVTPMVSPGVLNRGQQQAFGAANLMTGVRKVVPPPARVLVEPLKPVQIPVCMSPTCATHAAELKQPTKPKFIYDFDTVLFHCKSSPLLHGVYILSALAAHVFFPPVPVVDSTNDRIMPKDTSNLDQVVYQLPDLPLAFTQILNVPHAHKEGDDVQCALTVPAMQGWVVQGDAITKPFSSVYDLFDVVTSSQSLCTDKKAPRIIQAEYLHEQLERYETLRANPLSGANELPLLLSAVAKLRLYLRQQPAFNAFLKLAVKYDVAVYSRLSLPLLLGALLITGVSAVVPASLAVSTFTRSVTPEIYKSVIEQCTSQQSLVSFENLNGITGVDPTTDIFYLADWSLYRGVPIPDTLQTTNEVNPSDARLTPFKQLIQRLGTATPVYIISTVYPYGYKNTHNVYIALVKGAAGIGRVIAQATGST